MIGNSIFFLLLDKQYSCIVATLYYGGLIHTGFSRTYKSLFLHLFIQVMVKIADVAYPYQKPGRRVERLFSYMERFVNFSALTCYIMHECGVTYSTCYVTFINELLMTVCSLLLSFHSLFITHTRVFHQHSIKFLTPIIQFTDLAIFLV